MEGVERQDASDPSPRHKWRAVTAVTAVALLVLVVVGAVLLWPRGVTPVHRDQAVADFKKRAADVADSTVPAGASRSALFEPGVYTYRASGTEDLKLGAFPAEHREIPRTVTAVVVPAGNGCATLTLNLMEQHTEDTTYCRDADGDLSRPVQIRHQKIGALTAHVRTDCDPDVVLHSVTGVDDRGPMSLPLSCTMEMKAGPIVVHASLHGTAVRSPAAPLRVGETDVDVVGLVTVLEGDGDIPDRWEERFVLDSSSGLPVRIERHTALNGTLKLTEEFRLELVSTNPSR